MAMRAPRVSGKGGSGSLGSTEHSFLPDTLDEEILIWKPSLLTGKVWEKITRGILHQLAFDDMDNTSRSVTFVAEPVSSSSP
ncbi:Os12g0631550 [Oryza sativa Japonica Group]|uniref:Os12g0631550 protein n=1 Tax=Oryza sativa subsp. japonica TaxID=39947 RepID=A0A0N7KUE8_ORYSJ|nr:Os12g0631550 [Oryza sativa Japonica Group]